MIIASEDKAFHTKFYLFLGAFFLAYQTLVRNLGYGTKGVWIGIAAYQWMRLAAFALRVKRKILLKIE